MKKIRKITVAICLIVSIVISGIFSFHVSAALSDYSTCVAHHFDRIEGNVPSNVHGSCGYVALSLFLSFYDVYWNENLVADKYEAHNTVSSGILDPNPTPHLALEHDALKKYVNGNELTSAQYKTFIEVNKDNYFHMYLLYLASTNDKSNGFIPMLNLLDEDYGIQTSEMKILLEYYLYVICGIDSRGVTVHMEESQGLLTSEENSTFLQGIRNKVNGNEEGGVNNSGIPVIYSGKDISANTRHAMIAYDTRAKEGKEDDVLLHMGYTSDSYTSIYNTVYNYDVRIIWIEINEEYFPHVHCSDYTWRETGEMVCSCVAYKDMHPAHEHKPASGAAMCPSANKTADCICGEKVNGAHRYVNPFYTSSNHWYECACGENSEATSHILTKYTNYSSEEHKHSCECGYTVYEQHNLTQRSESSDYHITECICGYYEEETHVLTFGGFSASGHTLVCECGYTREETHSLAYQRASDEYHRLVCDCGYSYNEDHTLTYQDYHTDICVCGYTYTTPHNFTYQEGSDENHHIATCECGYDGEVWHTWTYKSTSTSHHSCICPCGYVKIGEAHVFEQVGIRYSVCKFCGYTRDNTGPGGNVIMGEKIEEEKE